MIPCSILLVESDEDKAFMTSLYRKHGSLMYMMANRYAKQPADAEDIVSQCCESLIRNIDTIRSLSEVSLRSYIVTTARNSAISYLRKQQRYRSGQIANLKSMNKIMNYLIANKIATVSDLETFFDDVYGKYHDLGDSIRQQDGRRKELTELLRCSENMKKYQPVFDELQTLRWKGKKEKYKAEHDRELTIYYAARRTLKENPGNPAAWRKELEQIETEVTELNQQRGELYGDVQMLFQIQNAVNKVLHEERKAERQPIPHPNSQHNREDENLE